VPPGRLEDWRGWTFVPVTGNLPGGLVDGSNRLVRVCTADGWERPGRSSLPAHMDPARSRVSGKIWRVSRNGAFARACPQTPDRFDGVEILSDGRWNFETVQDLAATTGKCFLATKAGMATVADRRPGLAGLWGDVGEISEVAMLEGRLLANRAGGGTVAFDAGRWLTTALRSTLVPEEEVFEGARWRITRRNRVVSLEVGRSTGTAPTKALVRQGRFRFDHCAAAHLASDGVAVLWTEEGLIERPAGGDVIGRRLAGTRPTERVQFFRVASTSPGGGPLLARDESGRVYRRGTAWDLLPPRMAEAQWQRHRTVRCAGRRWRVIRDQEGVAFELHLTEDPDGLYKRVTFDPGRGLFGFDDFRCLTTAGPARELLLGTGCGAQTLLPNGGPARLWCLESYRGKIQDGIGPVSVERIASDDQGIAHLEAASACYALSAGAFRPSDRRRLRMALSLRAADPRGWRVSMTRQRNGHVTRIHWRGEPTFLTRGPRGGTRFAHNMIHSVAVTRDKLVLGTQAGLAFLDPPPSCKPIGIVLWNRAFLDEARSRGLSEDRMGVGWVKPDPDDANAVFARLRGARQQLTWRIGRGIDGSDGGKWTHIPAKAPRASSHVSSDGVLVWEHPEEARVSIGFCPGKVIPAHEPPVIRSGTFTFVDLDVPRFREAATLTRADSGLFWCSRAGIVQFDPIKNELIRLHVRSGDRGQRLGSVQGLHLRLEDRELFATTPDGRLRFDRARGTWVSASPSPDPFTSDDIVSSTTMLRWRRQGDRVRIELKNSDRADLPFFVDGRPAVDVVHDFTFIEKPPGDVALGTDGGVTVHDRQSFVFRNHRAAAFRRGPDTVVPVVEVASMTTGRAGARTCCRSRDAKTYEFLEGAWRERTGVEAVFAASYRRVYRAGTWSWSRYPQGLTCTLLETNGPPLRLGGAVDRSCSPIFSRERMAFDDARGVVLEGTDALVLTPVGVVRYRLDTGSQRSAYAGIDVWAESPAGKGVEAMFSVEGIRRDGDGISVWDARRVYETADPARRRWRISRRQRDDLSRSRRLVHGNSTWAIRVPSKSEHEVVVSYTALLISRRWHAAIGDPYVGDAAISGHGLWFLAGQKLFHVDLVRARRSFAIAFAAEPEPPDGSQVTPGTGPRTGD
jgi:hypothetical protein